MKYLVVIFLLVGVGLRAEEIYQVNCRAKVARSDVGTVGLKELVRTSETDTAIIRRAKIENTNFELQEFKDVFFFKPYIRFANGQELTTTGFFDATGVILLQSQQKLTNGVTETTDIRCCRDCTFKDWK